MSKTNDDTLSDKDLELFRRIAKSKAIKFARMNAPGNATLSVAALMDYPIRNSSLTAEDLMQELWIVGIKAFIESTSQIEAESKSYALNAMDWKINEIAEKMYADKRGAKEIHLGSEDSNNLFNSGSDYDEV